MNGDVEGRELTPPESGMPASLLGWGDVYVEPAWGEWPVLRATPSDSDHVLGLSPEARRDLRRRMLLAAQQYMAAVDVRAQQLGAQRQPLGDNATHLPSDTDRPIIMTGHQPLIFHPGLVFKYRATSQWAQQHGGQALAIVLDIDVGDPGEFICPRPAPQVEGALGVEDNGSSSGTHWPTSGVHTVSLCETPEGHVARGLYGTAKLLPSHELDAQFQLVQDWLFACGCDESVEVVRRVGNAYARWGNESAAAANIAIRHQFGVTPEIAELPMSVWCQLPPIRQAIHHLLLDFQRLHDCYNSALERYRAERQIANPANPFPNLASDGPRRETPFWAVSLTENRRVAVWARATSGGVLLDDGRQPFLRLDGDKNLVDDSGWADDLCLAPRGALVSLLFRLLSCDLFVHGRGGESYDRFTDQLIRDYLHLSPPAMTVASASRYLFTTARQRLRQLDRLQQQQREIAHHAENYLGQDIFAAPMEDAVHRLLVEKQQLVDSLRVKKQQGQSAAAEGKRLQALQQQMKTLVADALIEPLRDAATLTDAARAAIDCRTYPWFYFTQ